MKQTEKILGIIIILLMVARLISPFPFSAISITFSILFLSILYFGFSFALLNNIRFRNIFKIESYKGISALRIIGTIATGLILSLVVIYSLFKFQLWPYGNEGLSISLIGLLTVIITVSIKRLISKSKFYISFLTRLLLIGVISTTLYLLSYETLLEIKNRDYPEYVEAEKQSMRDPQNKILQEKAIEERKKMDLDK